MNKKALQLSLNSLLGRQQSNNQQAAVIAQDLRDLLLELEDDGQTDEA